MRRSSNSDDISYQQWKAKSDEGKVHRIFLDGVEQNKVTTADEFAGYIIRAVLDESGEVQIDPGNPDIIWEERVQGEVKILIEDRE